MSSALQENPTMDQIIHRKKIFISVLKYIKSLAVDHDDISYVFGCSKIISAYPELMDRILDVYNHVADGKEYFEEYHDDLTKELKLLAKCYDEKQAICSKCSDKG